MGAYSAADARKGNRLPEQIDGFLKTFLGDKCQIALNMNPRRTGTGTGGYPDFIYNCTLRLDSIQTMDGFVVGSRYGYRADVDTIPTSRARI